MDQKFTRTHASFIGLILSIAWFALIMQFAISIPEYMGKGRTPGGSVVQLLSYFTILSNILVAFSLTAIALFPETAAGRFFSKISTATAIAVYITIVSLVYNLVLRQFWHPKAAFKPADELLHVVIPVLYVLYWLIFLPKNELKWKQLPAWLIFPSVYLVYIIARGAATGLYPYFFLDAKTFGYAQVAINFGLLLLVFCFFSALFILTGKLLSGKNAGTS